MILRCSRIGLVLGIIVAVVGGYIAFELETAPIVPEVFVGFPRIFFMLCLARFTAPVGLAAGFIVGVVVKYGNTELN
jgi:hypothetical protein